MLTKRLSKRPTCRMLAGIEQRNRHVDGVHAAPLARVSGHVFAHRHHAIGLPQGFGLGLAREGAVRTERQRDGGAHQVDHARARRAQRGVQHQVRRIVGGGQDDLRIEAAHLAGEVGAQKRIARQDADFDAVQLEVGCWRRPTRDGNVRARPVRASSAACACLAEMFHARDHPHLVSARRQRLHQQAVRFVAAADRTGSRANCGPAECA